METIYKPNRRVWVSEKICLKEYFSQLEAMLPKNIAFQPEENNLPKKSKKSETNKKILELMKLPLNSEEFKFLEKSCSIDQLTVPAEPLTVDVKCLKQRPGLFDRSDIPESALHLETLKHQKNRIINDGVMINLKYRSSRWLDTEQDAEKNLVPGKHILVIVRVYHPFVHNPGQRCNRPPKCSQEIVLLGNQTLDVLRDKIVCSSDHAVRGELSNNPDQKITQQAKDFYKSGFIFIDDTFYNDFRHGNNKDNSEIIREWAQRRKLSTLHTARMEEVKFLDLTVRLGYPYVYQHQGNCEHLIVFSDVRFLHKTDSLSEENYPFCRSISSKHAHYCMICGFYIARWITTENDRVPHDPCFFCDHCFRSFNYIDGTKVTDFKAYPFYDQSAT